MGKLSKRLIFWKKKKKESGEMGNGIIKQDNVVNMIKVYHMKNPFLNITFLIILLRISYMYTMYFYHIYHLPLLQILPDTGPPAPHPLKIHRIAFVAHILMSMDSSTEVQGPHPQRQVTSLTIHGSSVRSKATCYNVEYPHLSQVLCKQHGCS